MVKYVQTFRVSIRHIAHLFLTAPPFPLHNLLYIAIVFVFTSVITNHVDIPPPSVTKKCERTLWQLILLIEMITIEVLLLCSRYFTNFCLSLTIPYLYTYMINNEYSAIAAMFLSSKIKLI